MEDLRVPLTPFATFTPTDEEGEILRVSCPCPVDVLEEVEWPADLPCPWEDDVASWSPTEPVAVVVAAWAGTTSRGSWRGLLLPPRRMEAVWREDDEPNMRVTLWQVCWTLHVNTPPLVQTTHYTDYTLHKSDHSAALVSHSAGRL